MPDTYATSVHSAPGSTPGPIFVIGGSEDKQGERRILREVAKELAGRPLALITIASHQPEGTLERYERAFEGFGVTELIEFHLDIRAESNDLERVALLADIGGIFFTGGDQLRLSSLLANTGVQRRLREAWLSGAVLAGTSAGASVLSDIMVIGGAGATSNRRGDVMLAPGLGVLRNMVIDQHFAERGRFGRLVGVVALSPRVLGIGVDEDTAFVVEGNSFRVLGSGAVYLVDGSHITWSSVADRTEDVLTVHDLSVHVLADGDRFDLETRRPTVRDHG